MQTNVHGAARDALSALIDYAGLFPPAKLGMGEAASEYLAARSGPYAWMLGRFIVPFSRVPELLAVLPQDGQCAVSIILDGGIRDAGLLSALRSERRLAIQGLEVVLEPAAIEAYVRALNEASLADVPSYVEFRRDERWQQTLGEGMPALGQRGLSAKVRCGGLTASAFPAPAELAAFIAAAARERVTFKATAGLHHPVRHFNPASGFTMHGFLNLLAAADLAARGASAAELERTIACEDSGKFVFGDGGITGSARQLFSSYGSCSFAEPIDDLRALGVLA